MNDSDFCLTQQVLGMQDALDDVAQIVKGKLREVEELKRERRMLLWILANRAGGRLEFLERDFVMMPPDAVLEEWSSMMNDNGEKVFVVVAKRT